RGALRSWLHDFIIYFGAKIAIISNPEAYAKQIVRNEAVLGRALNFAETSIALRNIIGDLDKCQLAYWGSKTGLQRFPLKRLVPWNYKPEGSQTEEAPVRLFDSEVAEGPPPDSLTNVENLRHRDRKIFSLINVP